MKGCVLLVWTACILAVTASLLRFVWIATAQERILTLSLILMAASGFRSRR